MMGLKYWCFETTMADAAIKDFSSELAAGEGSVNPGSQQAYEAVLRDFLNSHAAHKHGLIKEPEGML